MITKRRVTAVLATLCVVGAVQASRPVVTAQRTASRTRAHVTTLASAAFEGRLTGSTGEQLAAGYITAELQRIGAKPLPGHTDFREAFAFTAGSRDGGSSLTIANRTFSSRADLQALSFSDNADVSGPAVFAGYGIVVPDSQDFVYDSYAGLDVKDKVVVVLRYFPEDADQKTKAILVRYADLRYKALAARQHGAKALVVVTGPRSPNAGETIPMSFDTALAGSGIAAVSVNGDVGKALFAGVRDKTLETAQQDLDTGNPHVAGFPLDTTVSIHAAVVREKQTGHNIVAYLPATMPTTAVSKPWMMVGAHYDHLGHGESGSSLAGKEEVGQIHFGADDNASGTAAVLSIGAQLARAPRHRNVVLALWSGEELGLLGSAAFAADPPLPLDQLAAYLNFDMVGRMRDNKLTLQALGTSPAWPGIIERANVAAGFDLILQPDPYQPTDVATFSLANVASLAFFTGTHVDYHRPTDTADKIDYDDLDRIVDFAVAMLTRVENTDAAPLFTKVEQAQTGGLRGGVRVFTGTIPDYSSDAKGLALSGVIGGGPAEMAGLQKGDIIIEIAGQSITNIYDYTYALEVLKIDQPTKVVYMRNGQRRETTLTPAARR